MSMVLASLNPATLLFDLMLLFTSGKSVAKKKLIKNLAQALLFRGFTVTVLLIFFTFLVLFLWTAPDQLSVKYQLYGG